MANKPNTPRLEEKLPFIWRELTDMCDAPISVWIDCMWDPLGKMVMEYYMLDLWQILTTFARPNIFYGSSRIGRHGSRGQKGRRGKLRRVLDFIVGFDPNDFLGHLLPFGEEIREGPVTLGRARLWLIFGLIERVTFWWFVFELVSDFLYRWMSAVQETRYCQARNDAIFLSKGFAGIAIGIFGWSPAFLGDPLKFRRIVFYNGFGIMQDSAPGMAWGQVTFKSQDASNPGEIGLRIRVIAGPSTGVVNTALESTVSDEEIALSVQIPVSAGDTVILETLGNHNIYDFFDGFMLVQCPVPE